MRIFRIGEGALGVGPNDSQEIASVSGGGGAMNELQEATQHREEGGGSSPDFFLSQKKGHLRPGGGEISARWGGFYSSPSVGGGGATIQVLGRVTQALKRGKPSTGSEFIPWISSNSKLHQFKGFFGKKSP